MKFYILSSGDYSSHEVHALLVSIEPVDWDAQVAKMAAWLNENIEEPEFWNLSHGQMMQMFSGVGLPVLECPGINITEHYTPGGDESGKQWRVTWDDISHTEDDDS